MCLYRIASPAKRFLVGSCSAVILVSFYIYHVHYLTFVMFSYSYNMKANVTAGTFSIGIPVVNYFCGRFRFYNNFTVRFDCH